MDISVRIGGREIVIDDEGNPLYISGLAQQVDQQIEEIRRKTQKADSHVVSLLTALHFADEVAKVKARLKSLSHLLDKELNENP